MGQSSMNANAPVESGGSPEQTAKRLPTELTSFATRKEARARELAARFGAELPPVVWAFLTAAKQGDWPEVARLGEELRQNLTGFEGDPSYAANELSRRAFSKLRSSIAGLYDWRARADSDPAGRRRMAGAADFAFRQAFALNPHSPEAVFRSVNHFLSEHRPADCQSAIRQVGNLRYGRFMGGMT
jgi:hypothetical protein